MVINTYKTDDPEFHRQSPEIGLLEVVETTGEENVLDIGCGCGKQCFSLSLKTKSVLGIDLQEFMINHANEKYSNSNIKYICDDFINVDLQDDYYDIIICQNVMFHVADKETFLNKIYSLLKRGGQFAFTDLTAHIEISNDENLAYPVPPNYYTKMLTKLGFSNVMFYFEKHWIWDGQYSGKNYSMFKCSK